MLKRSIAVFLLVAILGGMMVACAAKNEAITEDKAVEIALADLGITRADTESIHIHEGMHDNILSYNVYITADGVSMTYVVSKLNGDILSVEEGAGHSH